jgi:hypothetical protein
MSFQFMGVEVDKILFVCCSGDCRRDEEGKLIKAIEAKGNEFARNSQFIMSEFVKFRRSRIEVKRTYFVIQDKLKEGVVGRLFSKAKACSCKPLTFRQEAMIANRLIC